MKPESEFTEDTLVSYKGNLAVIVCDVWNDSIPPTVAIRELDPVTHRATGPLIKVMCSELVFHQHGVKPSIEDLLNKARDGMMIMLRILADKDRGKDWDALGIESEWGEYHVRVMTEFEERCKSAGPLTPESYDEWHAILSDVDRFYDWTRPLNDIIFHGDPTLTNKALAARLWTEDFDIAQRRALDALDELPGRLYAFWLDHSV